MQQLLTVEQVGMLLEAVAQDDATRVTCSRLEGLELFGWCLSGGFGDDLLDSHS